MEYYKEKNMQFKLANTQAQEDFSIWPAYKADKTDPVYQGMSFPLKEGHEIKDEQGNVHMVSDLKFMKAIDFNTKFSKFGRNYKVIRQILINGTEYNYRFSMTANNKLKTLIESVTSLGQDPLKTQVKI